MRKAGKTGGAAKSWGVSGLARHKNQWGVSGHCPCPDRRSALHSTPAISAR